MVLGALAITAIAVGSTGIGLQLKGQHQAAKAAVQQADVEAETENAWNIYNAQVAERDARTEEAIAERRATEELEAAADEEKKFRKAGAELKAKQRVAFGQAGVTFEGSPELVLQKTATDLEVDALMIRRSGGARAGEARFGGQMLSERFTAEAALSRFAARSALLKGRPSLRAARFKMAGSALTSFGQLGSQFT